MATLRMTPVPGSPVAAQSGVNPAQAALNQNFPGLGTVISVQGEIDDVLADMKEFHRAQPDQVMAACSAHQARLVEMAVLIGRLEVQFRQWKPVGQEVDKVISALREQFNIASRLIAVRQLDQELLRGGT